jgi:nucleotide-binding universal stress UspA family protein
MKTGENRMQNEQTFKKILVPVDGSVPSNVAREFASFMARQFNSRVTVIHVVAHELMGPGVQKFTEPEDRHEHPHVGFSGGAAMSPSVHAYETPGTPYSEQIAREITNVCSQEGEDILGDALRALKQEGVYADQKLVVEADPASVILKVAEEGNYDIIIMGSSEEEEKEPHLGSVAKKVAHHARIPVLIARGKSSMSKILIPVDGSKYAERAIQSAVALAKKAKADLTLLYVQESGIFRIRPEVSKEIGKRILSNASAQIKGIDVEQKLESGDPAKIIIKTANMGGHDLIVIGSRGHSTRERFSLGNVSDHIVQYVDRSVLITK